MGQADAHAGQGGIRHRLPRCRESSTVSKNKGNEDGGIFHNSSIDGRVMLEDLAASIIGGQVEGCVAILASLAHVIAITHKRG